MKTISDQLHKRLYGTQKPVRREQKFRAHLEKFGLYDAHDASSDTELEVPVWVTTAGDTLRSAAEYTAGEARKQLDNVIEWECPMVPDYMPEGSGWFSYDGHWKACQAPSGKVLVIDTETVKINHMTTPVCACAYDGSTWYIWRNSTTMRLISKLVPDGHGNLYIAHNAKYDAAMMESSYTDAVDRPVSNQWFCTMSAVTAVRGMSNQQLAMYKSNKDFHFQGWEQEATTVGLDACLQFYTSSGVDKTQRDDIWKTGYPLWQAKSGEILEYCCKDVGHTVTLAGYILPELKNTLPSLTSLSGMLLMASEFVPLRSQWKGFYGGVELAFHTAKKTINDSLQQLVDAAQQDGFNSFLDWEVKTNREGVTQPEWKKALAVKLQANKKKGNDNLSINWRECIALLKLTYLDHPIFWFDGSWCYDTSQKINNDNRNSFRVNTSHLTPLPHPDKRGAKMTKLIIKSTISWFDGLVCSQAADTKPLVDALVSMVNWESLRKRVANVECHTTPDGLIHIPKDDVNYGTITRRKGGKLFPVAPNPKEKRMGTEIKSYLSAPKGYKLVHFDVDSEEAVVFGLLGDMVEGVVGSTAVSVAVNVGQKAHKTDIHSIQAEATGLSRDLAKNLVYASFYGQGLKSGTGYILKGVPGMPEAEALKLAKKFQTNLRGDKSGYGDSTKLRGGMASDSYNVMADIASGENPRTPFLGSRIPYSLDTKEFKTTRENWVIQSTGRDILDALITLIVYGAKCENIDTRLVYTCHDEALFMVKDADTHKLARVVMIAHSVMYACLFEAMGIDTLPVARLYPEAVEIDIVWRKSHDAPCVTPTSPRAMRPGIVVNKENFA